MSRHRVIKTTLIKCLTSIAILSFLVSFNSVVAADKIIQLVTGTDYAPYTDPNLPDGGVVTAVVSRVFKEMGYASEVSYYPWKRAYKRVLEVQSDATFPYAKHPERELIFFYSRPINVINIRIFGHHDNDKRFLTLDNISDATYCQPLGYKTEPELISLIEQERLRRYEAPDMDACFKLLSLGRVDFVLANDLVAWAAAKRVLGDQALNLIIPAEKPLRQLFEYMIISKAHPDGEKLIIAFNEAYEKLLKSGVLENIWINALGGHASPAR